MFKNYITVAIRNLARHKAYTFINIIGLAIGLTCSTLILLYLQHEFSYDSHHTKADRIHRVIAEQQLSNGDITHPYGVQGPVASALAEDFPEIERTTRFYQRPVAIRVENKLHLRNGVTIADQEFFNVFDYPLIEGNAQTGLQTPYSIFITETLAHKLFGNESPMNKTITLESKWFDNTYTITGILKDIPATSSRELASALITTTFPSKDPKYMNEIQTNWDGLFISFTYILIKPNASIDALTKKLPDFISRHTDKEFTQNLSYKLMPLKQLYLQGRNYGIPGNNGDINACYAFGLIGLFILIVACINFMNLSTARSARRMREVGMRKVVGAKRTQLIYQFLGESILLSTLALILSLGLTELTLPHLNGFMNIQLSLDAGLLPLLVGLAIGVGLLSGSYPALFLSSFKPTAVLTKAPITKGRHALVRKGLVVVQFAISMILIAATIIVSEQTEYMRTADLGFKSETLVEMRGLWGVKAQAEAMKSQYLQHAGVHQVTMMHATVGNETDINTRFVSTQSMENPVRVYFALTDHDFLNTYQIPLLSGRNFTPQDYSVFESWDFRNASKVLINETAAKQLNVQVGDHIDFTGASREVIGIFQDFHNQSLHKAIRPLMLLHSRSDLQVFMTLRINTKNLPDVMAHLETVWKNFHPGRPSRFVFVNDSFDQQYQTEIQQRQLYAVCSGLAIAIACLGLLGLIAYTAEVRTKEIGIRKVLGATDYSIVSLLSKEFLILVALASLLAWPIAYYTMNDWLQNFAYRIDLSPVYFLISTSTALIITLITIAYQALKAARANPIEALRYE
ncbi:MAG: putative ABC transport system permease protein [Candidatus Latescibacterota bacterium]|jgi:putative ABC transport system permease protein